jgi:uncharacterized membrane protein YcaP (DUF421 family)
MSYITGDWTHLGWVALKALLMYATALGALRLGERRTLAQWTLIDFATAVAMGAIVGRTATATTQSYATGAVALVTLIAVHRVVSVLRFNAMFNRVVDHPIRVLVHNGSIRRRELRRCGLTDDDLFSQLRQKGILSLDDLRYVLYESKGSISVITHPQGIEAAESPLMDAALDEAAGYTAPTN